MSEREDIIKDSNSSFRLTKLTNMETLNTKANFQGPSTSRFNGVVIPKIFFSRTTEVKPLPK